MSIQTTESPEALHPFEADSSGLQVVSFGLADEEYGVDIMNVQEIVLIGKITEMPQVPGYVRGLINLRGNVIPVFDLRKRMGLTESRATDASRIVILNVHERTIGIVVDAVNEVLRVGENQIEPAPSGLCGLGEVYVRGLVKFESRLLILLNIDELVGEDTTPTAEEAALP